MDFKREEEKSEPLVLHDEGDPFIEASSDFPSHRYLSAEACIHKLSVLGPWLLQSKDSSEFPTCYCNFSVTSRMLEKPHEPLVHSGLPSDGSTF